MSRVGGMLPEEITNHVWGKEFVQNVSIQVFSFGNMCLNTKFETKAYEMWREKDGVWKIE